MRIGVPNPVLNAKWLECEFRDVVMQCFCYVGVTTPGFCNLGSDSVSRLSFHGVPCGEEQYESALNCE